MQKNPRLSLRRPWGIAAFSHPDYDRRLRHWTESADPQSSGDDCGARGLAAICMPAYRRWGVPPRPEDTARIRAEAGSVEPGVSTSCCGRPEKCRIFGVDRRAGRNRQISSATPARGLHQTLCRLNFVFSHSAVRHAHSPHLRLAPRPALHGQEPAGRASGADRLAADPG